MSEVLCLTIRFLDSLPGFHGRADGGGPEWPPSPLRLFQALVDAAADHWRTRQFDDYARPALSWFEKLAAPTVLAPAHHVGVPIRIAVPNNDLDVWATPLSKGLEPKKQPNALKTMKTVRPTHLLSGDAVHYLYPLPDGNCPHFEVLSAAARSVTHLGWGIDMAAGSATILSDDEAAKLSGERWSAAADGAGTPLRVPIDGTLGNLSRKHEAFLNRLSDEGFKPVPPLTAFRVVSYRRTTDTAARLAFVPFRIVSVEPDGKNPAFDTTRQARDVAAMVRNAAGRVYAAEDGASFVHGHDPAVAGKPAKGIGADVRMSFPPAADR
jgi:CRISPR-associated protein Csb2